MNIPD
jgi:hypothetical protein